LGLIFPPVLQRPKLETVKAEVTHTEQKIDTSKKNVEKLKKDIARYVCFLLPSCCPHLAA